MKAQRHCEIYTDTTLFRRVGIELEAYENPLMLISEENAGNDPIHRRLVSALHRFGVDVVEMRVPSRGIDAVELERCCNIAREEGVNIILAYDEGAAIEYARAISICAWGPANAWHHYVTHTGEQSRKVIPFGHVFASLKQYDSWAQAFGGVPTSPIEPEFAVQVTTAV